MNMFCEIKSLPQSMQVTEKHILFVQCLSGGSDGTVRLWSLGQQRCITTYRIHSEGVWALCADENFTGFYSGGRDKNVMWTDLSMDDSSTLLFVEDAPILNVSLCINHDFMDS